MQQNTVIPQWDQLPGLTWKEKIAYLTHQFLTMEQTDCPVEHRFEGQLYIREMRIPAGSLFIGRAHRHGHVCQLLEGEVIHVGEFGRTPVKAPFEMMSTPGYHMVLFAITDVIGRTVHPNPTESRDTHTLEADIFESVDALRQLGASVKARLYRQMLNDYQIDEAVLKPLIENEADQIPFPEEVSVQIGPSNIQGKGLIATADIAVGEAIAPVRINGMRTPAGRYANHDFDPNAYMIRPREDYIELVACKPIARAAEITVDYRHSIQVGLQP